MVTLIKEDGTGKPDANTYGDVIGARAFTSDRGVTLPAADNDVAVLLVKAMDYIAMLSDNFVGERAVADQALDWPRKHVWDADNEQEWPVSSIPPTLIKAQYAAVMAAQKTDLMPNQTGGFIVREAIGPISTEYSQSIGTTGQPRLVLFDTYIAPLLRNQFTRLRAVRG